MRPDQSKVRTITIALLFATAVVTPKLVAAQNPQTQAVQLIREAMTAYGNLDIATAQRLLDQAVALSPYLPAQQVARIYVSYGLVFVGGLGDNARGQQSFAIARCLDPTVQIDPLYSTPDVDMIFKLAAATATPANCPGYLQGVQYAAQPTVPAPQPQPLPQPQPQPQPAAPPGPAGVPQCGQHTPLAAQRDATEIPLTVQINPVFLSKLARIQIKYAFDGGTTYFDWPMKIDKDSGWATAIITCAEGQITDFNPSIVNYFIEGFDASGTLICGHGAATAPFAIQMTPSSPVVKGIPGMPEPKQCKECPPWDQECQAASGAAIPCFTDDECPEGSKCLIDGYCEGTGPDGDEEEDDEDDGFGSGDANADVPKVFYVNVSAGTGGGFGSAPNKWILHVALLGSDASSVVGVWNKGAKGGSWGGLGVRAALGFNLNPDFALEAGFRLDASLGFRKQVDPQWCETAGAIPNSSLTCNLPASAVGNPLYTGLVMASAGGGASVYTTKSGASKPPILINLRARYRFVNDHKLQVSMFAGAGYGHLLFLVPDKLNGVSRDANLNGKKDPVIVNPGMVNIELGPGFAYYFNPHVGFIMELPIDFVFGEDSSFGLNAEFTLGLSFGG